MAYFWLTPIISKKPLALGAERIKCEPLVEITNFRQKLDMTHAWLLPLFKANLLLADDNTEVCGNDNEELTLSLAAAEDIVFDGLPYVLSHCAENFLERLLTIEQTLQGLDDAGAAFDELWSPVQRGWLAFMLKWLQLNCEIIIVREEEWE